MLDQRFIIFVSHSLGTLLASLLHSLSLSVLHSLSVSPAGVSGREEDVTRRKYDATAVSGPETELYSSCAAPRG